MIQEMGMAPDVFGNYAGPAGNASQRLLDYPHGNANFFLEQLVNPAKQAPAAAKVYHVFVNIADEFRRSRFDQILNRLNDQLDRSCHPETNLGISDRDPPRQAGSHIASANHNLEAFAQGYRRTGGYFYLLGRRLRR